ncbi:MAG: hypothetical protein ACU0DT_05990 [Albimonas sp.]|uniref:hypothetical protein n=1 Tax=Albimonas sp. TaxID=1872425 RepID=UPI004055CC48
MTQETALRDPAAMPGAGARGEALASRSPEDRGASEAGAGGPVEARDGRIPLGSVARDLEDADMPGEAAGRLDPARAGSEPRPGEPAPGARWLFGAVTLAAAVVVLSVTLL